MPTDAATPHATPSASMALELLQMFARGEI